MNWRHPGYNTWLDWQIAIRDGRVKFHPNNRIDRLMSDREAMAIYDQIRAVTSPPAPRGLND